MRMGTRFRGHLTGSQISIEIFCFFISLGARSHPCFESPEVWLGFVVCDCRTGSAKQASSTYDPSYSPFFLLIMTCKT